MTTIKNIKGTSAETIYHLLKTDFTEYVNSKLGSNLAVEFAHVSDIVNVSFPEVIENTAFTLTVTDEEIEISNNATDAEYNTELLEENLIAFVTEAIG